MREVVNASGQQFLCPWSAVGAENRAASQVVTSIKMDVMSPRGRPRYWAKGPVGLARQGSSGQPEQAHAEGT